MDRTQPLTTSPLETAVLALAGAVLVVSGLFLAAAYLASFSLADGSFHAGLGDAGRAMLALPDHLGDPRAAWSPDQAAALPGPSGYWAAMVVVVLIAGAIGAVAARLILRSRRSKHPVGVEDHPGLAAARHLRKLVIARPTGDRITLGRAGSKLLAAEAQASLAVIGPSGYGKSSAFAVPNLLEWDGPIICTSVKSDLAATTLAHRSKVGTAWVFDPTGCTGLPQSTWSPLAGCGNWSDALRTAAWLSEASQATAGVTDADYWYTQGRSALAPHLFAAAVGGSTMRDVHRWIVTQEQDAVRKALRNHAGLTTEVDQAMAAAGRAERRCEPRSTPRSPTPSARSCMPAPTTSPKLADLPVAQWPADMQAQLADRIEDELDRRIRPVIEAELLRQGVEIGTPGVDALLAVEGLWAKEERLRGSVYSTVENILLVYADPVVARATDGSDIDVEAWLDGPNTIYVVATADEQSRLRPLLAVLVQSAIRRAYETANRNGGTLARPCLLLLDEAGNIAPLPDLPTYAATARSHGISLVTIWQDLAQVDAIYGNRAQTVMNNHRAKVVLGGIADPKTLEWVSRLAGEVERTERNWTADATGRRSVSEHTTRQRAVPEDVLRRLPENEALLLYGSLPAAHIRLRPWWKERSLRRLGTQTPPRSGRRSGRRLSGFAPAWERATSAKGRP